MSSLVATQADKLASSLGVQGTGSELVQTLKATAFKGDVSNAQLAALMIVANQYGLNPWTKEIYAFDDKRNGIVPVVGVDGWARIINSHPEFDGMDFEQDAESCTCIIYRKDRAHPVRVTEYMKECYRGTGPWQSHPRRMLRHKAMIQCARLAFGFVGIYEQDEAERIVEAVAVQHAAEPPADPRPALEPYSDDALTANLEKWRALIQKGTRTAEEIIAFVTAKATLTDEQKQAIQDLAIVEAEIIEGEGE